jgi:hypothetical protein
VVVETDMRMGERAATTVDRGGPGRWTRIFVHTGDGGSLPRDSIFGNNVIPTVEDSMGRVAACVLADGRGS